MRLARRGFLKILGGIAALPLVSRTAWADRTTSAVLGQTHQRARQCIMGYGPTVVPARGVAQIAVSPSLVFRPERLVIPEGIAPSIVIRDVLVGKLPQLSCEIPGAVFSPAAVFDSGMRLEMDACRAAGTITLVVENVTDVEVRFQAAVIGDVLEPVQEVSIEEMREKRLTWLYRRKLGMPPERSFLARLFSRRA